MEIFMFGLEIDYRHFETNKKIMYFRYMIYQIIKNIKSRELFETVNKTTINIKSINIQPSPIQELNNEFVNPYQPNLKTLITFNHI